MSLVSTGEIVSEIEELMQPRLDKAAAHLADCFRANLPKRTGATAANVDVVQDKENRMTRIVRIPFPWQFSEFGTIRQRANPVGRRTLLAEGDKISAILAGEA
jgi:hypothetical protein